MSDEGGRSAVAAEVDTDEGRIQAILVRSGRRRFCWENSCPHTGAPLDWVPGRFLDAQRRFLLCATHGALFEPETGLCVAGPCRGDRLRALPLPPED